MRVVKVDPMSETGVLLPFVAQRMLKLARQTHSEYDGELVCKRWLHRLVSGDPSLLILAIVDEEGMFRGHVAAALETDGGARRWVFVLQAWVDGPTDRSIRERAIQVLDNWGRSYGAERMLMGTRRDTAVWQRQYGFSHSRSILERPIGAPLRRERSREVV